MVLRQAIKWPHKFIDTEDALKAAIKLLKTGSINTHGVAVDVEAFCVSRHAKHLGEISLLQLAGPADPAVYIFDVVTLGADRVAHYAKRVLCHPLIKKYMFDCRKDVEAIAIQMGLQLVNVQDLQLYHTSTEWMSKGSNRRSHIDFVLQSLAGITPSDDLKAVKAAFNLGRRKVWDERPLPEHLVSYAANDVRHMLVLADHFAEKFSSIEQKVEELTKEYTTHYCTGSLVTEDLDPKSNKVSEELLKKHISDGAVCKHCGKSGHSAEKCFNKDKTAIRCASCGSQGHLSNRCFKIHPERNKCDFCGQTGHLSSMCYINHPCEKCGGKHPTAKCLGNTPKQVTLPKGVRKPEIDCIIHKGARLVQLEKQIAERRERIVAEREAQGAAGPGRGFSGPPTGAWGRGRGAPTRGWGAPRGAGPAPSDPPRGGSSWGGGGWGARPPRGGFHQSIVR
uniref:CCHC-type domain-containing protein n=1 Tax=Paramoeba aestuarina TaxID=180227 RepID=A0A7S4PM25_9EUKA|mmetsp:Transcript_8435/g.12746  ORF Transcript_8435/g.12746 Transcript_8435/m.12746 type:complete len:451 (+) Transcript_8435:32-1384(+)